MIFYRSTYRYTADLFLRLVGIVYIIAIYSLWTQLTGLIGEKGILPVAQFIEQVKASPAGITFLDLPTLMWWFNSDAALSAICICGMITGGLMVLGIVPLASAFVCWILYLSLTVGGQVFLGFQWDNLLLETGLLAVLLAPPVWRSRPSVNPDPPRLVIFLIYWLLFRLMFASGYVKLASQDESWWNLTALTFHFWTQPLPMWTAWYMDQAPLWFLKTATAVMFFIELAVPFLIFANRISRYIAFVLLIFLQVVIAMTGNYGFFNVLTAVLCFILLDDRVFLNRKEQDPNTLSVGTRVFWAAYRWPLALIILFISTASFAVLLKRDLRLPAPVVTTMKAAAPFRSVNQYGLFAAMTKKRPEIIIEGSQDGQNWAAYEFFWKPGDVHRTPVFVAPHMPRLDWQMWFAALGSYQGNPWLVNLLVRMLEGEPNVLALLERNPFAKEPPQFIRAVLYEYTFALPEQNKKEYLWWNRELKGLYCPVLTRKP